MSQYKFQAESNVRAEGARRFKGVGYSGAPVVGAVGLQSRAIVDLSRLTIETPLGVLSEHNPIARAGVLESARVENNQLLIEGRFLESTIGASINRDMEAGFPFQASLGLDGDARRLGEGETATINGRRIEGPILILGPSVVREVTLTSVAADANARVSIAASRAAAFGRGRGRGLGLAKSASAGSMFTMDTLAIELNADPDRLQQLRDAGVIAPDKRGEHGEALYDLHRARDSIERHDRSRRAWLGSAAETTLRQPSLIRMPAR